MSTTTSQALEVAFQVIDSMTRVRGITGAMLVDPEGQTIAQDFVSMADGDRLGPTGVKLSAQLGDGCRKLQLGEIDSALIQTTGMALRTAQHDGIKLLVYAGNNANLGMLNVELRNVSQVLRLMVAKSVTAELRTEKQTILDTIRTTGSVQTILEERRSDLLALRKLHETTFQIALDTGITREIISRTINDINYRVYRDSLIDIGFDFFNRKALDNYDPALARKLMEEQVIGLAQLIATSGR
jgi:predicted regulator of Ras-like GTPase activity (Roadblock/LC7/MglB family)